MTFEASSVSLLTFNSLFTMTLTPLLNLLYILIAVAIGIGIARLIQTLVTWLLQSVRLDDLADILKITPYLTKAEIKRTPSKLLGDAAYWLSIYFLIMGVLVVLGLPIGAALDKVFSYAGVVLLAAVILSLGSFLEMFISGLVYLITASLGISGAKTISKIIQYATIIFAFLLALEQLGIGPALLVPSIGVIIGALGLAVAIAFGLGCKDIMADFVSNLIRGK